MTWHHPALAAGALRESDEEIKQLKAKVADLSAINAEMLKALEAAVVHIEHMAAWISRHNSGYSFEGLGEDAPGIRAAISSAKREP